jgi:hypothetical protein
VAVAKFRCVVGKVKERETVIMDDHDGEGVVPGRYPGKAIRLYEGPTPQSMAYEDKRAHADGLAGRICAAAADAARSAYTLLELVGEFDALDAIQYWNDFKSLAHWSQSVSDLGLDVSLMIVCASASRSGVNGQTMTQCM